MARTRNDTATARRLATPQSVNAVVKSICDIMRRSNCAGALQYVPELTWILFLRILDEREAAEAEAAKAVGAEFTPTLAAPRQKIVADLLFFTRGGPTEKVWYYDLSDVKVGKKSPLTIAHFEEFFRLLPGRSDSDHSWTVTRAEIDARGFDLKAVNPHAKSVEDTRTPGELLEIIEAKGREVALAIAELRALTAKARAEEAAARMTGSSSAP